MRVAQDKRRALHRERCVVVAVLFASSCGGAPISIVRQYIDQQQTPH